MLADNQVSVFGGIQYVSSILIFIFHGVECTFHGLEYTFHGVEYTFQPMEHKTNPSVKIIQSQGESKCLGEKMEKWMRSAIGVTSLVWDAEVVQ